MKRISILIIFVTALVSITPIKVESATVSTFNTGLEGWSVNGGITFWEAVGGNPGGYLRASDAGLGWAQLIAPASILGAWQNSGTVSADIKTLGLPAFYNLAFAVSDGNSSYQYIFNRLPDTAWWNFAVSLTDPGWQKATYDQWYDWNPPSGSETLVDVLLNVTDFRIRVDFITQTDSVFDQSGLDNVSVPKVSEIPIPPTIWIMGSGIIGLLGIKRRYFS